MSHPNGLVTFQGFLDLWEQKKKKLNWNQRFYTFCYFVDKVIPRQITVMIREFVVKLIASLDFFNKHVLESFQCLGFSCI